MLFLLVVTNLEDLRGIQNKSEGGIMNVLACCSVSFLASHLLRSPSPRPRRLPLPEPAAAVAAQQEAPAAQLAPVGAQLRPADHDPQLAQLAGHHAQQLALQLVHQRLLRPPLCRSHQVGQGPGWWWELEM